MALTAALRRARVVSALGLVIAGTAIDEVRVLVHDERWKPLAEAALPIRVLVLMLAVLAVSLYALAAGSNLWGIWLAFAAPVACLYLLGLFLLRWVRGAEQAG